MASIEDFEDFRIEGAIGVEVVSDHQDLTNTWNSRGAFRTGVEEQSTTNRVNSASETKVLLMEMLSDTYQENIALKLLDPQIQIKDFLSNVDIQDLSVVKLFMRVVIKASENNLLENNFREFLKTIFDSPFVTKRLDHLINVPMHLSLDIEVLEILIQFLKLLFQILPGLAYDALFSRVLNLSSMVENFILKNYNINDEILAEFDDLKALSNNSCPYLTNEKQKKIKPVLSDSLDPPNNYREISIFPTMEDLNMVRKNVFLRRNKIVGSYKTVDDYLDVQFRLMREDFIQPLREGLFCFTKDHKKIRLDIRIYKSVYVMNSLPVDRMGIVYNITFYNSHVQHVNWIHSKRFIYGSLLCLSDDNFQTLLFATVAQREVKDLEQGIVTVKFHDSAPSKNTEYKMIETINMFESYRHVLVKLQETNEKNLCLQKYLVFADQNINLPGYLSRNNGLEYTVSELKFFPGLDNCQWPSATELGLDESQFQAFKTALTNEISIIQGPPGTGKTYLGLKICSCLLENVQKKFGNFGPILVVCYTNHALDQFLEGISKFTDNIMRIGNRCKSECLRNYSLFLYRQRTSLDDTSRRKEDILNQMGNIKKELIQHQVELTIVYDTVINLKQLDMFMDENHRSCFKKLSIQNWLNGDSFEVEISTDEMPLNFLIEWIIFEEIIGIVHSIIRESLFEIKNNKISFINYNDTEANIIDDNRLLDTDEDISNVNAEFQSKVSHILATSFITDMIPTCNDGFTVVKSQAIKRLFKKRLLSKIVMTQIEANSLEHIDDLKINDRWRLYGYWRNCYIEYLNTKSRELEYSYDNLSKQLNEICFEEDRSVMMTRDVIGMTTTGAARYGRVLAQIRCKIIIVEEAAEVLESHVVASLNPGCEHLILIGDHKQLKPNPAVYELAKTYQLDLSLFERLINNNLHFNTLELQHRMRPEISEIMKFIYPDLKNHPLVLEYPNVPAVSTNIFFFDHSKKESYADDISSYSNHFEAEFVVNFCHHLIKNGVENYRITILTLYSGQLFLIKSMIQKYIFEGIRVCVADNYQGEENDIIILSLVRSNEEDRIGFLSIENRICVCLSRAKMGLYVFGDFQLLSNQNDLWKDICLHLRRKHLLGDTLALYCQNHAEKRLEVKYPNDFKKYPDGGCERLCRQKLICGHFCRKACHFMDKNHREYQCMEKCTKLCPNGHRCNLKCWETCGDCFMKVAKIIPTCNHEIFIECSKNPLPSMCKKIVIKTSTNCGHEGEYECSDKLLNCTKRCSTILDCGHTCEGSCSCCDVGRLHAACNSKCNKLLICGHICKVICSVYCPPCYNKCEEGCVHKICPNKCGFECDPCIKECEWKCEHKRCTKQCYEKCDRDICNEHCEKIITCNKCGRIFQCYGVCGELCRMICLECDPAVKDIFFGTEKNKDAMFITLWTCGHSFECESMDEYMNTVADNQEIVPKRCPKCNTVINKRSCFRYLSIVRNIYQDIKLVQYLIRTNEESTCYLRFFEVYEIQLSKIKSIFTSLHLDNYFLKLTRESKPLSNFNISKYSMSLDLVCKISDDLLPKSNEHYPFVIYPIFYLHFNLTHLEKFVCKLIKWLNPAIRSFSSFEMNQFYSEFDRIKLYRNLNEFHKSRPRSQELIDLIKELEQCQNYSRDFAEVFKAKLQACVSEEYFSLIMVKTEREHGDLVGFGNGRWFKCSNGHYYVISECWGSNLIIKCPECTPESDGTNN